MEAADITLISGSLNRRSGSRNMLPQRRVVRESPSLLQITAVADET